jgi:hypothetical protein
VPTGPWLSVVYHIRACYRYYGLIRQSDKLRPAWASSAYSGRSSPLRAVRLTFPSLLGQSAITTRPNHSLPRQDLHLQVCQWLKAAHRKSLFARPPVLSAARVNGQRAIETIPCHGEACAPGKVTSPTSRIYDPLAKYLLHSRWMLDVGCWMLPPHGRPFPPGKRQRIKGLHSALGLPVRPSADG